MIERLRLAIIVGSANLIWLVGGYAHVLAAAAIANDHAREELTLATLKALAKQ